MTDRQVDFLLIGGGVAAANCARALREEGADGTILLVGRELDPPYNRPPCSKGYLTGRTSREDALFERPEWWDEHGIELLTRTSVLKLDIEERTAALSTKEKVGFHRALIATGANVRRLSVDGSQLEGIHYLRAFGNADAIRQGAADAEAIALIGGSYIGCEVAASLTELGKRCEVVMQEEVALEHHFGQRVGAFVHGLLERHGIRFHAGDQLARFEGEGDRLERLVTRQGREVAADLAVIGVGAVPDVRLAQSAGLQMGERGGVLCSAELETSAPGIYAAGDICEYESALHERPTRIEHWDVASKQGAHAARAMLGRGTPFDAVPYFWSNFSDWAKLEYVGLGVEPDQEVVRGSVEGGEFSVWQLREGRLTGTVTVGRPGDLDHARRLITEKKQVAERLSALGDPSTDLAAL